VNWPSHARRSTCYDIWNAVGRQTVWPSVPTTGTDSGAILRPAPVRREWNKAGTSRDDHWLSHLRPRGGLAPALPSFIVQPLWVQVSALLPTRQDTHSPGCHRPRIPDRVVFDKLIQVLVFGCGYRRIADTTCSRPRCAAAGMSGSAPT
jgi:hypothetical protein